MPMSSTPSGRGIVVTVVAVAVVVPARISSAARRTVRAIASAYARLRRASRSMSEEACGIVDVNEAGWIKRVTACALTKMPEPATWDDPRLHSD